MIANKCGEKISDWVQDYVRDESYLIPTYHDDEVQDLVVKLDGLIWLFNKLGRPKSAKLIRQCQILLSRNSHGDNSAIPKLS